MGDYPEIMKQTLEETVFYRYISFSIISFFKIVFFFLYENSVGDQTNFKASASLTVTYSPTAYYILSFI